VLLAPLGEELVFRSWLSGRPAIIAFVLLALLGLGALLPASMLVEDAPARLALSGLGLAIGLIGAPLAAWLLLRRRVPPLFVRVFPLLFWASTLGFALVHLGNYAEGSLAILLPLVLPQFALGTMLGYLRVHHGLVPAIALHASHNAILFGLAILGGLGGEAEGLAASLLA
jgi:membrane protease YdiL (CAAX protease family)